MHTREDEWWIARSSGGVDRISNGELEHLELYASNILRIVVAMLEDRTGRLWFCFLSGRRRIRSSLPQAWDEQDQRAG